MLPQGYYTQYCDYPMEHPTNYPVTFMGIDRPSKALRAMLKGLNDADARSTFTIDMTTFGQYERAGDMCYGCAATCALMELSGDPRLVKTVSNRLFGTLGHTINLQYPGALKFESAIDYLRSGRPFGLFKFFELEDYMITSNELSTLTSTNWKQHIHQYEQLADVWEQHGL